MPESLASGAGIQDGYRPKTGNAAHRDLDTPYGQHGALPSVAAAAIYADALTVTMCGTGCREIVKSEVGAIDAR